MTKQDFLNEAKAYIEDCYAQFEEYQENVNDVLDVFHELCRTNGVHYYVAYGSLLGLIRDGGDIPWDYDIDVLVPITEEQKLLDMLDSNLPDDYYYMYKSKVDDCPTECLRICKKGSSYMALHLDVFFMIGAPDDKKKRDQFVKKLIKISSKRSCKFGSRHIEPEEAHGLTNKISRVFNKMRFGLLSAGKLKRIEDKMTFKYPLGSTAYCTVMDILTSSFGGSHFGEGKELTVNGKVRMIPDDPDGFLKEIYGDYTRYFPIKNRFDEFYNMKNIVEQRQKYYVEHQMKK